MFPKPEPGTFRRERHARKSDAKAHEQREMQAAKRRDHNKCRWPGCDSGTVKLRIDAAHLRQAHRGMGGNPDGLRTERAKVICLCRLHHRQYDHFDVRIDPQTDKVFDGPCDYYRGDMFIASEKVFGVSVTRESK